MTCPRDGAALLPLFSQSGDGTPFVNYLKCPICFLAFWHDGPSIFDGKSPFHKLTHSGRLVALSAEQRERVERL